MMNAMKLFILVISLASGLYGCQKKSNPAQDAGSGGGGAIFEESPSATPTPDTTVSPTANPSVTPTATATPTTGGGSLALSNQLVDFGTIDLGSSPVDSKPTQLVRLFNDGQAPLYLGAISFNKITETNRFEIGTQCPQTLAVGQQCEITVTLHDGTKTPNNSVSEAKIVIGSLATIPVKAIVRKGIRVVMVFNGPDPLEIEKNQFHDFILPTGPVENVQVRWSDDHKNAIADFYIKGASGSFSSVATGVDVATSETETVNFGGRVAYGRIRISARKDPMSIVWVKVTYRTPVSE